MIEAAGRKMMPAGSGKQCGVRLGLPEECERLPLRVVIHAGKANEIRVGSGTWGFDFIHQIPALSDFDDLTWLGEVRGVGHGGASSGECVPPRAWAWGKERSRGQ